MQVVRVRKAFALFDMLELNVLVEGLKLSLHPERHTTRSPIPQYLHVAAPTTAHQLK